MAISPTKTVTNPRIAKLIELEVAGRIKPEHQRELDTYRAQGLAPKKASGALTEAQGKSTGFYERAVSADTDFLKTHAATEPRGVLGQFAANVLPKDVVNAATSADRQKAEQAKKNWISASLRYESGAAIGKDEFTNQDITFFPQPGDSAEVIAQKARARQIVADGLKVASGPGATPDSHASPAPVSPALTAPAGNAPGRPPPSPPAPGGSPPAPPSAPSAPMGGNEVDIGFSGKPVASTNPQQEQAFAAFFAANPKASAQQIQQFASAMGIKGTIANADQLAAYYSKGGKGFGGFTELTPEAVKKAAAATGDTSAGATGTTSSAVAGLVDSVPFAPQIGAVADTLGLSGNRPSIFNSKESIGDIYAFNRDANNLALNNASEAHPFAYGAGQAGGLAVGAAGAARAVPALGRLAAWVGEGSLPAQVLKTAPLNAAYGTFYGAGRNPEDPLKGAISNAALATAGGALGQTAVGVLGRAIAPTGGRAAELYARGVRPTLGQRFGGIVNWAEQNAGSIPILGAAFRGARQQARDQFERGAFNDALGDIGQQLPHDMQLGTEPHAFMQNAFNQAYDQARSGMQFVPDDQFRAGLSDLANEVRSGVLDDGEVRRFATIANNAVGSRLERAGGALNGTAYKTTVSDLEGMARDIGRTNPNLAQRVSDLAGLVDDAARRNSDPEAVALLDAADTGYAKAVRIEQAAAARGGGDTGRFSPNQFDRSVQKASGGVRSRAYLRGDALMGDYAEAGKMLSDTVPNSGSPERMLTAGVLTGGLGYISPQAAAAGSVLTLPYLAGVRNLTAAAIAPRQSAAANTLGALLRRNAAIGAPLAAPALLPQGSANGN